MRRLSISISEGTAGRIGATYPRSASKRARTTCGGLVVQGGFARLDVPRLVEGFRRIAGDEVAEIADRSFRGEEVADEEWARVGAAFGPCVPDKEQEARARENLELNEPGMELLRSVDIVDQLARVDSPTLVVVGELDPVTPVAAATEILDALPRDMAQLEVIDGAGHWAWKDTPDRYWSIIAEFINTRAEIPALRPG